MNNLNKYCDHLLKECRMLDKGFKKKAKLDRMVMYLFLGFAISLWVGIWIIILIRL